MWYYIISIFCRKLEVMMLEIIKIDSHGIVQDSDPNAVAIVYQQRRDMDLFNKEKDKLLVDILKIIILDNAKYFKSSGRFNFKGTIKRFVDDHKGLFPMLCITDENGLPYNNCDDFSECRNDFKNWIFRWDYPEKGIHIESAFENPKSSNIVDDRSLLLDFLCYFNYKRYGGSFNERIKQINKDLDSFGYDGLYPLRWFDLSLMVAHKLATSNDDVYTLFYDIYNNHELKSIISTKELREYDCNKETEYTSYINTDFNRITSIGDINDNTWPISANANISACQFLNHYKYHFERARISSYDVFCSLCCGESLEKINKRISTETSMDILDKRDYVFRTLLNAIKSTRQLTPSVANKEKANAINAIADSFFDRDQYDNFTSLRKESIVWMLILCMRASSVKMFTNGRVGAQNSKIVGKKIEKEINKMLINIGMSSLNGRFHKSDFLLLNAIYHTDYKTVYDTQESFYPYRDYIFNCIFTNMNEKQQTDEIKQIVNSLGY